MDHGTCKNLGVAGFMTSALVIMMIMIQEGVGPGFQLRFAHEVACYTPKHRDYRDKRVPNHLGRTSGFDGLL